MLNPEGSFLKPYLSKQNDLIPACLSRTIGEKEIMQALGVEREFFKVHVKYRVMLSKGGERPRSSGFMAPVLHMIRVNSER